MRNRYRSNLTNSIVQNLGADIVAGVYTFDKKFPIESELCEKFGASRSVLREAVKMLTAKGLLAARPRHGTWVEREENWNSLDPDVLEWLLKRKLDINLLEEFTEIRMAVEPQAAALAAKRADDKHLLQIKKSVARMRAAELGDDDPLESDLAFHVAVLDASGNRFISQLRDLIGTALHFSIRLTNRYKGVSLANVDEHEAVADAIVAGRPTAASRAAMIIIRDALELIRTHKEQML